MSGLAHRTQEDLERALRAGGAELVSHVEDYDGHIVVVRHLGLQATGSGLTFGEALANAVPDLIEHERAVRQQRGAA